MLAGAWKTMRPQEVPDQMGDLTRRHGWRWHAGRRLCVVLTLLLLALPRWAAAQDGPQVAVAKSVHPATVPTEGRVTYAITLTNSGNVAAEGLTVHDVLPEGFAYRPGTSRVTVNGVGVSTADPAISGRTLSWASVQLPSGRRDSFYGIHTFVQSRWDP